MYVEYCYSIGNFPCNSNLERLYQNHKVGINMVRKLSINQYRKIKDKEFNFSTGINVISGSNGTCKTSLLHIISNAFKAVNKSNNWIKDTNCIETIKKVNKITNSKVESLTRGDKQYRDPARGLKGSLFTVEYFDQESLNFRRHNSSENDRYSIKPFYQRNSEDKLPSCPVIYLGLSRLYPFGEFNNDAAITGIKKSLPTNYQNEVAELYKKCTGIAICFISSQNMGDIKVRADFSSDKDGIDSNTISAGEDNIYIILTALVSLKYYFDCIQSNNSVESVLLIDELDATLHPALQIKLLNIFKEYSDKYKIQIIFTTHSLSLLESALLKKYNVIYLIDNIDSIIIMDDPDIYKIKMYLHSITKDDIYLNKAIPIFTEDEEARIFLNIIFDYYNTIHGNDFLKVKNLFHFVKSNIGASNLLTIFDDEYLIKSTMRSICILDGDQESKKDYNKCVLALPGGDSPENLIMKYSKNLYLSNSSFWTDEIILGSNYGKVYYRDTVLPDIEGIELKINQLESEGKSTKGVRRNENKKVFNRYDRFFQFLFKHWVNAAENQSKLEEFYKDLYVMFKKVAGFHGINPNDWKNI